MSIKDLIRKDWGGEGLSAVDLLAYVAGCIVFVSFVPQVIKTWRTKKVDDLSLAMFYMTMVSNSLYVVYAILTNLVPVFITMALICSITLVQIVLIHKYRVKS